MDINQLIDRFNNSSMSWIDKEIESSLKTIINCENERDSYKESPIYSDEPIQNVIIKLTELVQYKYRLAEIYFILSKCYRLILDNNKREYYLKESLALDKNRLEPLLEIISILELKNPHYEKKLNSGELLTYKKLVEPLLLDQLNIASNQVEIKEKLARIFINYKDDEAKKIILELMMDHHALNGFYMYSSFWPQNEFFIYAYFEHLKSMFPNEPHLYSFFSSYYHKLGDYKNEYYNLLIAESLEKSDNNIYSEMIRFEHETLNYNVWQGHGLREHDIESAKQKFNNLDLNYYLPDNIIGTWKNDEICFTLDKFRKVFIEFINGQKAYGYCSKVINNSGFFKFTTNYEFYGTYSFKILKIEQNYLELQDLDKNMIDSYYRFEKSCHN